MPLKKQPLELLKAMDVLQHEIVNIGMTFVIPHSMRLRMRDDEPDRFPLSSQTDPGKDGRVAANMVNCRDWIYLERLL